MIRARVLALLPLVLPCCATAASEDRRAYILAHPHGWIELTIADRSVPPIPVDSEPKDGKADLWVIPPHCDVEVHVNGEPFISDRAYPAPDGDEPLARVDTGFRIPAAVGAARVHLVYNHCRIEGEETKGVSLDAEIVVQENTTHEILFNGEALYAEPPRPNNVVTLEDVYEAITGRRSLAK